jgi:hypothetical protein
VVLDLDHATYEPLRIADAVPGKHSCAERAWFSNPDEMREVFIEGRRTGNGIATRLGVDTYDVR